MLIGFYSKGRQAGKDTAAGFVREWCTDRDLVFERKAFADVPKLLVAETLGIARGSSDAKRVAQVDEFKLRGVVAWTPDGRCPLGGHMTGRDFIINLCGPLGEAEPGGARKLFGESFWTDIVLPSNWEPTAAVTVVTDVRAADEAIRVAALGGRVVEIVNPRAVAASGRSERGLDASLVHARIWNTGTLEEFRAAVLGQIQVLWRQLHPELHLWRRSGEGTADG